MTVKIDIVLEVYTLKNLIAKSKPAYCKSLSYAFILSILWSNEDNDFQQISVMYRSLPKRQVLYFYTDLFRVQARWQ